MTLVIDPTVGGATANSFVSAAEMTAYCDGRLNASVWLGDGTQNAALVEATRELAALSWQGRTVTETQALTWPRLYVVNPDSSWYQYFATTSIPRRVKDATCELALQFLKAGTTDIAAMPPTEGIIEKAIDVLVTKWADPRAQAKGLRRYPSVWRTIKPMLDASGSFTIALVRS